MPRMVYGVGATKAGTSWFYRALSRHPGCALRSIKELHYFDTFAPDDQARQARVFRRQQTSMESGADRARLAGQESTARTRLRNADEMGQLSAVIEGDRTDDAAYRAFVAGEAGDRLAADVTPAYALLSVEMLRRMLDAFPGARVVYLVRDPVARLWSHVRMHAARARPEAAEFEDRANAMLRRVLDEGAEEHIHVRGDYPAAVRRLREVIPKGDLRIEYAEQLYSAEGWAAMQAFLGLDPHPAETGTVAFAGPQATLRPDLRRKATLRLAPHYDWAARELGPLPAEWQATLERAHL